MNSTKVFGDITTMRYLLFLFAIGFSHSLCANNAELVIYHDADYTSHSSSAESMAMGFNTALAEVNHQVQGYSLKLIAKDHHGNVKRSKLHMKQFLKDSNALAMLGGLHSPPYITNRNFINENGVLLLVPLAAGGPITRYDAGTNWVYRVSIDDTKAGYRLADFAVNAKACKAPHLLLENTGWGKSNYKTLTQALNQQSDIFPGISWFEWNTKKNAARTILREISELKADCIIFVGNSIEGEVFSRAMISMPTEKRLPIISHWGITGGNFHQIYSNHLHGVLDLSFVQTCFSFISTPPNPLSQQVLQQASKLYPGKIQKGTDITAPPGFIHAYDIGKILLSALNQVTLTGDIQKDRSKIRDALENLNSAVVGLVKTYNPPFTPLNSNNNDGHEALGLDDFCMAHYDSKGLIHVLTNQPQLTNLNQ